MTAQSQTGADLVLDGHCHLGPYPAGVVDVEGLLEEMDRNGVDRAVISPGSMEEESIEEKNDAIVSAVRAHPDRLIGLAAVDPSSRAAAGREIQRAADEGLVGIKLRPSFSLDTDDVSPAIEAASEKRLPVYVHSGSVARHVIGDIIPIAHRHKRTPIILSYRKSPPFRENLTMEACPYSNIYFDTSSITPANIRFLLRRLGPGRVVFGSGYPFGSQRDELAKTRRALSTDAIPLVLHDNLARILGI